MRIAMRTGNTAALLTTTPFEKEEALENTIALHPSLLCADGDPELRLVARQVALRDSGFLDLLLVTAEGLPVVVETKLFVNGECRREILAQAVDYISALTQLTNEELDAACNEKLEKALRSFAADGEDADEAFERRWAAVGLNLRQGTARVVLALDDVPPSLQRMVRFLAENSQLDIQLIKVEQYLTPGPAATTVVVPHVLVSRSTVTRRAAPSTPGEIRPKLREVLETYDATAAADLRTVGTSPTYRQIRLAEWPGALKTHYEFYTSSKEISAELHLESEAARPLATILKSLDGHAICGGAVQLLWDPAWNTGRGRLRARFSHEDSAEQIARAMHELIALTRPRVTSAIAQLGAVQS